MSIKGFYINGSVQKYDYESLDNKPASGDGLTEQAKRALLACFEQVAWIGQDGQSYYDALEEALYPQGYVNVTNNLTWCRSTNEAITAAVGKPYTATIIADSGYSLTGAEVSITMGGTSVTGYYSNGTISIPNVTGDIVITVTAASSVSSISAVFTQGSATIYDTDSLDTLRQYLTVTAYYADTTSATVNDYELSGTLTAGTSTITVSYGGKTATFSVSVTLWQPNVSICVGWPNNNLYDASYAPNNKKRAVINPFYILCPAGTYEVSLGSFNGSTTYYYNPTALEKTDVTSAIDWSYENNTAKTFISNSPEQLNYSKPAANEDGAINWMNDLRTFTLAQTQFLTITFCCGTAGTTAFTETDRTNLLNNFTLRRLS